KVENHDVLIQHLQILVGDDHNDIAGDQKDGMSIGGQSGSYARDAYNITIDHVSINWAIDEGLTTWFPTTHDVTVSNSIVAEGLQNSIHPKGPHSKGVMVSDLNKNIT